MDADAFSTGVRKFFRNLRMTAQREIEKAIRTADAKRKLTGTTLQTKAVVTVSGIDLKLEVDGDIELA
jgi:N-acetylglutamate synthase/N-acetylornithine aminotransferase